VVTKKVAEKIKAKKPKEPASRLRIIGGVAALLISLVAGVLTVVWYTQGTSDPYVVPSGWGRVNIYLPPQASSCAAAMTMGYDEDGTQSITLQVRLSGLPHLKYGPAIGIIFDGSAMPPDSPQGCGQSRYCCSEGWFEA
jgi:hypothetical protein